MYLDFERRTQRRNPCRHPRSREFPRFATCVYHSYLSGSYKCVSRVKQRLNSFLVWKLEHVPRESNEKADALASVAASLPITETIFLPIYYQPVSSIASPQVNQVDKDPPSWIDPITLYLSTGQLPTERDKAHKLQIQATIFSLIDGQLFKQSLGGLYLKCVTPEQSQYVLAELHKGICGNHPTALWPIGPILKGTIGQP